MARKEKIVDWNSSTNWLPPLVREGSFPIPKTVSVPISRDDVFATLDGNAQWSKGFKEHVRGSG